MKLIKQSIGQKSRLMQSKNKKPMTGPERVHVAKVKELGCVICGAEGPSEAHEPEQGLWWLSIALCADCHRGSHNGIHGQRRAWSVTHMDENRATNETLRRVYGDR